MAKLVSVFISPTHRRLIAAMVWVVTFMAVLAVAGGYTLHKTAQVARAQAQHGAGQFLQLRSSLTTVFDLMHEQLTAAPCSPAFHEQLRRIAYLPDGLNEFLYAPGGRPRCSTRLAAFHQPVDFGRPDIGSHSADGMALWIDRDLGFLGLAGEKGTFALSDPFVAVIPPQNADAHPSPWLSMELVLVDADGAWFHRGGASGIYGRQLQDGGSSPLWSGRIGDLACDADGVRCVAVEADLAALAASEKGALALVLAAAALISGYASNRTARFISRHWSFEARFRRHLDAGSIVCAYQPVMRLDSGEIVGCEVLARWRDIDGSIVFPDRFISLVERNGMTMELTRLVAERACQELSRAVLPQTRIKVGFNIFPRDLDCAALLQIFAGFIARPERFDLVLEITESDEMPAGAQGEIEALRRAGIRTYIDDFGTGYSNMHNLAALAVDGVKLDRSFAMAPDNSVMAQMLRHAVEMIQAAGRVTVVEGVETAERLALLRSMQARIDFVQGYHIARPLDIDAFAAFLKPEATAHLAGPCPQSVRTRTGGRIHAGKIAV